MLLLDSMYNTALGHMEKLIMEVRSKQRSEIRNLNNSGREGHQLDKVSSVNGPQKNHYEKN